jgi:hypothetical protein
MKMEASSKRKVECLSENLTRLLIQSIAADAQVESKVNCLCYPALFPSRILDRKVVPPQIYCILVNDLKQDLFVYLPGNSTNSSFPSQVTLVTTTPLT